MHDLEWFFDPEPPRGSPAGAAWRNTLAGTSQGSDRIAREAIQNSKDALTSENSIAEVRFAIRDVSGEARAHILDLLKFRGEFESHALSETSGLPRASAVRASDDSATRLLYVEDFGTTGLSGELDDSKSNWFKFVFGLGEADKGEGGGSFGFGKSVFPAVSSSFTIVAYTCYGESDKRLIGITFLNKHEIEGRTYTGRGWLCKFEEPYARPLVGDEAEALASALGFQRTSELGTSILVFDAIVEPEALSRGIETHWWPAIEDGSLHATVTSSEGPALIPRPKSRTDLQPYLRAYRIAIGAAEPEGEYEKRHDYKHLGMGVLGAVAERQPPVDDVEDMQVPGNCVALIRNPRMVVQYLGVMPRSSVSYHAAFVAAPEMDMMFRQAEPPAHDKWEADQGRLESLEDPVLAMEIVSRLKNNLYQQLRSWLLPLRPAPEVPSDRVRILDEYLSKFLRTSNAGPVVGPTAVSDPVTYETIADSFETDGDETVLTFGAKISVKPDLDVDSLEAWVRPSCFPLLDANLRRDSGERIPIKVDIQPSNAIVSRSDGGWRITLKKDESVTVRATTSPFDARYIVEHEIGLEGVS